MISMQMVPSVSAGGIAEKDLSLPESLENGCKAEWTILGWTD